MQNHSGPFLLGTVRIHSDSPSWEECAAWIPKAVQVKHKPSKSKEIWPRSPMSLCLCAAWGPRLLFRFLQLLNKVSVQGLCSVTFPPRLAYIFISWIWFCLLMIFNCLSPSSNRSMKSLRFIFYLFDAFLKCTFPELRHGAAALTVLPFKVGLLWVFSRRLSGRSPFARG